MSRYTASCLFYLDYENGKWVAEQEVPHIRVEAETPEEALRGAMEEWIKYLKETEEGKKWLYLISQEGKVTLWDLEHNEKARMEFKKWKEREE